MIAGEGAGFLIVEEHDHARKRGARIYAEIAGYGNTSSAYHIYNPEPSGNGIIRTTMRALRDAELQPEDIDWVCADGISTTESDKAEACALRAVFQDYILSVPVSATKSVTGHMGSGAGAAESVYSVMAINNDIMPPTINYNNPDDDCKLNIVANTPVEKKIDIAVNINQGIGGQSTALIFKKFTG
jgi:3-oxoacyl-(acyl-carrier-protein) synthase